MKFAAFFLACLLIPGAGYCGNSSAETPVPATRSAEPYIAPLTRQETLTLEQQQATSSTLLSEQGAGCRQVWDNVTQQYKTICMDPTRTGILFGLYGGVLGALLGGPAGMVFGAVVGGVGGYAMADSEYGD